MSAVVVRPAGADDEAALVEVFASTRAPEISALGGRDAAADFVDLQYRAQHHGLRALAGEPAVLAIEVDGAVAGRLLLSRSDRSLHVYDIAVLGDRRGRGVGTEAMRRVQAMAADAGVPVTLRVRWESPARRLYDRLGFAATSANGVDIEMIWRPAVS